MSLEKKHQEKSRLHPRNKNRERYDLSALTTANPALKKYVSLNKFGDASIDFANPLAVKLLNTAILNHYYGIESWEFPDENLCPPIPGRADYIHHLADLLSENNSKTIPIGDTITCLDVGLGASCIYPIIGVSEYQWNFIGSDINPISIKAAKSIANANPSLNGKVECRLQKNLNSIFRGIITSEDKIDLTLCNPPFHSSIEEAQKGTRRKIKNLSGQKINAPDLNLAGNSNELVTKGGEYQFIHNMIRESILFSKNCYWFTTLVSKQSNLKEIYKSLERIGANQSKTIPLGTSNKSSRIVAWTFLNREEREEWKETRWRT